MQDRLSSSVLSPVAAAVIPSGARAQRRPAVIPSGAPQARRRGIATVPVEPAAAPNGRRRLRWRAHADAAETATTLKVAFKGSESLKAFRRERDKKLSSALTP